MSEWIEQENGVKYKDITTNGEWEVIKLWGDGAYYSYCPHCGYMHGCWRSERNPEDGCYGMIVYAPEKEFNYCPKCGTRMLEELNG